MTTGPSQGLNIASPPQAYSDSFIALDLMKGLAEWNYYKPSGSVQLRDSQLKLDEKGWVTELPVIDGEATGIFANVFYGAVYPARKLIMEWTGEGSIDVNQPYTVIGPNKIMIDFVPDYTDAQGKPQEDGLTLVLNSTDPNNTGNHIRDIKLYAAEDADLIAAGEHFNPIWFDRVDDFRVLRTHDWQSTNFPTAVDWTRNIETADQAHWAREGRGMPYELMVEMANQTRSDLWINIPHTASDQYMREAAAYVKANLDPGLQLMVEFSNEYWTEGFDQNAYFIAGGRREFGTDAFAAGQFYGTEAANMAKIFAKEFGANSTVLRPTLTVDDIMFETGEAEAMLTAPSSVAQGGVRPVTQGFDVIATDGYLSWYAPDVSVADMIRGWMKDADGGFGRARDFLIDQLNNELLPNWQKGKALADKYGLDFMVYEGGTLLLNNGNLDPALTDFAIRFSNSAELKEVYEAELAAWATVGTGPFAWYSDTGRPGDYGDYGMWNGINYTPEPRADAVTDANTNIKPWWDGDNRPASTFDNGKYAAGTAGSETMTGTTLADRLYGRAGNDNLVGNAGADRLWGGLGNDVLRGGTGADTLNGGDGRDTADYSASTAGVKVNLATKTTAGGHAAGDVLTGVEILKGSAFGDRLVGDAATNTITGGAGNDTIAGGRNGDQLSGGAGNDRFYYGSTANGRDTITDFAALGDDFIYLSKAAFGNHAAGGLAPGEFQSSTAATAQSARTRIIYDQDDHQIWYDADGRGGAAAVLLATLQAGATVTAADFVFY
jgi:hypothetical protein